VKVQLDDPASILWLQQSLLLLTTAHLVPNGQFDKLTRREVGIYQVWKRLPKTCLPDEATIQSIEQDLAPRREVRALKPQGRYKVPRGPKK
jgi:hypothetical protein